MANVGSVGLDWQERINWDRLRKYRLERAREKMKAHGLVERIGRGYRYRLTDKGTHAALLFILFHQRVCGPLAYSLFHHRPRKPSSPPARLKPPSTKPIAQFKRCSICSPPENSER